MEDAMPIRIIAYTLLGLLLFSACAAPAPASKVETVSVDGATLTVTFDPGTLSAGVIQTEHGQYTFRYESPETIVIQYPDGYVYEQTNISGGIATPADYDGAERSAKGYLDGFSLVWGIEGAADQARNTRSGGGPSPFLALLLLGLGAWNLFAPKSAWWLARGWWYKNAEPSDLAIAAYRIGGVCLLIAGVICAIAAL